MKLECSRQRETTSNETTLIQGNACAYRGIQKGGTTYLVRLKEFSLKESWRALESPERDVERRHGLVACLVAGLKLTKPLF